MAVGHVKVNPEVWMYGDLKYPTPPPNPTSLVKVSSIYGTSSTWIMLPKEVAEMGVNVGLLHTCNCGVPYHWNGTTHSKEKECFSSFIQWLQEYAPEVLQQAEKSVTFMKNLKSLGGEQLISANLTSTSSPSPKKTKTPMKKAEEVIEMWGEPEGDKEMFLRLYMMQCHKALQKWGPYSFSLWDAVKKVEERDKAQKKEIKKLQKKVEKLTSPEKGIEIRMEDAA